MSGALKRVLFWVGILAPVLLWLFVEVNLDAAFVYDVPVVARLNFLEHKFLYLNIHLFVFLPVLFLSFDKKVAYFKSWKYLFPAIGIVGLLFIIWDAIFTNWNVWGFNEAYFLGWRILGLPFEEWLFFLTVPFASIFIFACLNAYFPKDHLKPFDFLISNGLGFLFLILAIIHLDKIYTTTTFFMTGLALLLHYWFFQNSWRTRFYRAYALTLVPYLLVDGVLTGAYTNAPVVLYNPEEFLGIRWTAAPVEDSVYGMLLLFLILTLMHWMGQGKMKSA